MISTLIIAIYMVAFLLNRKAKYILFTCLCCEYIGWSALFSWSNDVYYGMFTHLMWGVIYFTYALLRKPKGKLLFFCAVMVLFQFIMSFDSWSCDGDKTNMFILYKYVLVVIHCCIVSTFIKRRRIVGIVDGITATFRGFINDNVLNLVFWYTTIINQKTKQ